MANNNFNLINTRQLVELASKMMAENQFLPSCIIRLGVSRKIGSSDRFKTVFYVRKNPESTPSVYGETRYLYRSVAGAMKAIREAVKSVDMSLNTIIENR